MEYNTPQMLSPPPGLTIRAISSFTPSCSHLLGTAIDGNGDMTVVRWDRQGNAQPLLGRLRDDDVGRVFATDNGLVVLSATRVYSGIPRPLAFTAGSTVVTDLSASFPVRTRVLAMNASGAFVGECVTATGSYAYVATLSSVRVVVPPKPAVEANAKAITDAGVVLGSWRTSATSPWRAYIERGGVTEDLGEHVLADFNQTTIAVGRPSTANPEHVCGTYDLRERPIVWRQITPPPPAVEARGYFIDDFGRVGGYSWPPNLMFNAQGFVTSTASQWLADLFKTTAYDGLLQCMGRSGAIAVKMHTGGFYVAEPRAAVAPSIRTEVRPRLR